MLPRKFRYTCLPVLLLLQFTACKKTGTENPQQQVEAMQLLNISGNVKDCNNAPLAYGQATILTEPGGGYYFYDTIRNGQFDLAISHNYPIQSVKVYVTDFASLKCSDTAEFQVSGNEVNIGTLVSCFSDVDEFFRYTIDDSDYLFLPRSEDSLKLISWTYPDGQPMTAVSRDCYYPNCFSLEFQFDGHTAGTFSVTGRDRLFINKYYSFNMPPTGSITYTTYGNVHEKVEGFMNVPFIDNTDSLTHILTGNFRLRRKA